MVTSKNTLAGSSCLLQLANYKTAFNDEGSIKEVTCSPLHFRLLERQTVFFPACQCQEPIKEQWWGYNLGKQCKDGPSHCSSALLLQKCLAVGLYFWLTCRAELCFKFYLKTWLYKLWLCSWLTGNCIPTLILFGPFGGLTCFSSLTTNQKYGLRYFRIKSKWIL